MFCTIFPCSARGNFGIWPERRPPRRWAAGGTEKKLRRRNKGRFPKQKQIDGFVAPVDGPHVITSSFSVREHPLFGYTKMHPAIDLAKNQGSPIYAIAAGTVTTAAYGDANGYYVSLAHGSGYTSIYCHMTKYIVSVGDSVSQGQVIGYVGSTGWSTGPHLHFELHQNGTALNPAEYLPLS